MQTTLRLDDDLYRQAKAEAARRGMSLSRFLEQAIRDSLQQPPVTVSDDQLRIPSYDCGGTLPGVRLDDNSALQDYLDEVDGPARR